jgi:hypothetical protein
MGISTDANVSFGIEVEEGFEFPWGEAWDIENWLMEKLGYKPPHTHLYDDQHCRTKEWNEKQSNENWDHKHKWEEDNIPIEFVNTCSGDEPMWIIAVPGTVQTVYRGYPMPLNLKEPNTEAVSRFLDFLNEHGLPLKETEPRWYLSSFYG